MDARTIFTTVALMVLANGAVLANIYRDLPAGLRPAAWHWQIGTLFVAFGCSIFAFGAALPLWLMVSLANAGLAGGLIVYYWALQRFYGQTPSSMDLLPAIAATFCVFLFSAVHPHFLLRVTIISIYWLWILGRSVSILLRHREDASRSRRMLMVIYAVAMIYVVVRVLIYTQLDLPLGFSTATGHYVLNLISPVIMALPPTIGTTAFVLMCTDRVRRQLEQAASTDYLTGLPNRRSLVEGGAQRFRRARKHGAAFAVAVLDLDAFKAINDTHGHEAGDEALIHVAERLRRTARKGDLVARSGGEEFVVLLDDLDDDEAFAAIERMRAAVAGGVAQVEDIALRVTVSAGVARIADEDRNFDDVLRRADRALYRAKQSGRNRVMRAA